MRDLVLWWLASGVIGVVAMPYADQLMRPLPDRGISVARPFGLLLTGWLLWLGAFSGLLPYRGGSVALVVAALATGGVLLLARQRSALLTELRARWRYALAVEGVFVAAFCGFALLRAYAPETFGTEKPFESAFFQSILRSETFGPRDPWYGGEPMSYYYFGYVLLGAVTRLVGTAPSVAFNLGLAFTGGMAAAAAFGLVWNLIAARGSARPRLGVPLALLGPLFLLVVSNLEGVFENLAVRGVSSDRLYSALAIQNLDGPKSSSAWYPTEHWWWWRATRFGSSWNVQEFPFFSFLLGDLHAHVMVLPYTLTMLTIILALWRGGERFTPRYLGQHPWATGGVALVAGGLYVTNAWDFPTALVLLGLVMLARNYAGATALSLRPLLGAAVVLAMVTVAAVLLYLPFYIGFTATPTRLLVTQVLTSPVGIERQAVATSPVQYLLFWGPLLLPSLSYLLWRLTRLRPWRLDPALVVAAIGLGVLPALMWAAALIGIGGRTGLVDELRARGHLSLTWLAMISCVSIAVLVLVGETLRAAEDERRDGARVLTAAAMLTAFALILIPEYFFIQDIVVVSRHNTVFKFYYTAWTLLAVAGAAGIVEMLSAWWRRPGGAAGRPRRPRIAIKAAGWVVAAGAMLCAALVYSVTASLARAAETPGPPTLDGMAYLRRSQPDEWAAARWLDANLDGLPVVLEATGPEYAEGSLRISARTGFPTVVGWVNHEWQQRGVLAPIEQRIADVATMYTSRDAQQVQSLLRRYRVQYVVVGDYERLRYRDVGLGGPVTRIGRAVFESGSVTIYAVDGVCDDTTSAR